MSEAPPIQLFVRNDKGQIFGPLNPLTVELLIDNGTITGRVQISFDGRNYLFPGRVPGIRMAFPKELWGDKVAPGDELDNAWSQVVMPAPLPGAPPVAPQFSRPSAILRASAAAAAADMAGPGAKAQSHARALNAAQLSHQARPGAPVGTASSPSGVIPAPPIAMGPGPVIAPVAGAQAAAAPGTAAPLAPPPGPPVMINAAKPATAAAPVAPAQPAAPAAPAAAPAAPKTQPSDAAAMKAALLEPIPADGTLHAASGRRLYFLAAAGEQTGLLTFKLSDRVISVHFRKGNPESFESSHPDDGVGALLVKQGLANEQQVQLAEGQKQRFGGELLPTLFATAVLNPGTAFPVLGQRASTLLLRAVTAESGTFTWQLMELPPNKALPLGNKWSLYAEALRRLPEQDLRRRMAAVLDLAVMKGQGAVPVGDLKLSAQETRALTRFDGVGSLNSLSVQFPNERETILRTAFIFQPCDVVSFSTVVVKSSAPAPAPATAAPAAAPTIGPPVVAPPPAGVPAAAAVAPAAVVAPAAAAPAPPGAPAGVPRPPVLTAAIPGPPGSPGAPAQPPKAPMPRPPPPTLTPVATAPAKTASPAPVVSAPRPGGNIPPLNPTPTPMTAASTASSQSGIRSSSSSSPIRSSPSSIASSPSSAIRPPMTPDQELAQLTELVEKMKKQTHFEVLGVNKEADAGAVKSAYFKLAKSYHPDTVQQGTPEPIAKAKAEIFARIGEAQRTLSDPTMKAEYLGELAAGGTGEKVDVARILEAEEFFQKGCILVRARKFPEAVKMLSDAINGNSEEAEFYAWRGYAKFFTFTDKKQGFSEAIRDINECTRRNPNVAAAYYFHGFILKATGDLAAAKTAFQKCTKLDPKHIDAQRELRLMK